MPRPRSDALTERERAASLWFIRLHLLETFIPWTLVKRGVKREVPTPLDEPEEFRDEAAAERQGWEEQRRLVESVATTIP